MGKYKKELVSKIVEEKKFFEEQEKLKEKHGIADEDVVIVEKDNMIKFFVRVIGKVLRMVATISILILAVIGLFTLFYPEIREPFIGILSVILKQYFNIIT